MIRCGVRCSPLVLRWSWSQAWFRHRRRSRGPRPTPTRADRGKTDAWVPPSNAGSVPMIGREVSFLTKLAESSRARDSIVCVGLDPDPDLIPEMLGSGPQAALRFLRRVIRATSDYVCAYKPNLAFYERYGSAAFDILALTLQSIPDDIAVVLDAKRGDVPNTAEAYAEALFGSFHADAATVAPYVGL